MLLSKRYHLAAKRNQKPKREQKTVFYFVVDAVGVGFEFLVLLAAAATFLLAMI